MTGFFIFLFLLNLMAVFNIQPLTVAYGDTVTILSIDGGGVRGIIPAVLLEHLEQALQNVSNDENARIADYFDVVAGTSTGGLMTAMLTAPDPNTGRPLFTAKGIVEFYKEECPHIFDQTEASQWNQLSPYSKYDGLYLHNKAREYLKETRLEETLTKVVIPSFDLEQLKPVIFSSFKTEKYPDLNALLSDITISTSAAPTYLPPYYFKNGETEFNMIDGGAAAANPALVAISEVAQEDQEKSKFLMLSLGTGSPEPHGWNATIADHWSYLYNWSVSSSSISNYATSDMVDYYVTSVFQAQQTVDNYLRIQEYNLSSDNNAMDNSTTENLDALEKVGRDLLNEPVKRMNIETFVPTPINIGTNAEALNSLAERLYELKQLRLAKRSLGRKGSRKIIKERGTWLASQ